MPVTVHASAIVDEGAQIGEGSRVWHFVHVCGGARVGRNVSMGQNVFIGNKVTIGDNCKIQNNVSEDLDSAIGTEATAKIKSEEWTNEATGNSGTSIKIERFIL